MAICELQYRDGEPLALCPRGALERAVGGWRSLGFEPQVGFELELYLLERDEAALGGWRPAGGDGHRVYGVGLGGDPTGLALEFFDAIEAMEIGLEGVLTEFSPGQMEVNLTYGPAVAAADAAQLVKEMTREIAEPARLPGDVHGPAGRHVRRLRTPCQLLARADLRRGQRLPRPVGARRVEHDRPPVDRRSPRPPRGGGRPVGAADQQLQAVDARADRRVLGELGAGQPLQHLPRAGRARLGHAHREPPAVWHRQPLPGGGGDAQRRAARCRRRDRLRRPADRRRRRCAEHRPATRRTRSPRRSMPWRPTPC